MGKVEYELKDIDEKNQAILISVDGFGVWLYYWEDKEGFVEWDFNQYIFHEWIERDIKTREAQNKIYDDIENFSYFMDDIFNNWGDALDTVEAMKEYENKKGGGINE